LYILLGLIVLADVIDTVVIYHPTDVCYLSDTSIVDKYLSFCFYYKFVAVLFLLLYFVICAYLYNCRA